MLDRLERETAHSDAAMCDSLLKVCEFAIRHSTAVLVASLPAPNEAGSLRYRMEYRLIRAASIGDWTRALSEILVGPSLSQLNGRYRYSGFQDGLSRLVKKLDTRDLNDSWAVEFSSAIERALEAIQEDPVSSGATKNQKFIGAVNGFSHLRNKMDAHGAPTAAMKREVGEILAPAVRGLLEHLVTLKLPIVKIVSPKVQRENGVAVIDVVGESAGVVSMKVNSEYRDISHRDGLYVVLKVSPSEVELGRINLIECSPELNEFFYANGSFNEQNNRAEFLSFVTSRKKKLDCTDWSAAPTGLPESVTAGTRNFHYEGTAVTNLPSHPSEYISRVNLERELEDELIAKNRHVITLKGLGGIGKTSLALEIATRSAQKSLFDVIVWASGRDLDLGETTSKPVKAEVETLEDLARLNAGLFSQVGECVEGSVIEWFTNLLSSDNHGRVLWILDNFETVRAPEAMVQYLSNNLHASHRVLITTRHREYQGDHAISVRGMEVPEFCELVRSCARLNRVPIEDKRILQIHADCEGHPYIAKLHVAELRSNPAASIKSTLNKDKIQEDLLERTYLRLDDDCKRVFLLLCTFKSVIYRLALKLAIESETLIDRDVDEVLDELVGNSLISSFAGDDGSFVSVPPIARSFGDRKLNASDEKLAIDAMAKVLKLFGPITQREAESVSSDDFGSPTFLKNFWKKTIETSDLELREKYLELVRLAASHHPVLWGWLSDYYKQQGDVKAAVEALRSEIESGGQRDGADVLRKLALLYRSLPDEYLEMQAWVRRAEIGSISIQDVYQTAGSVNGFLKDRPSLGSLERRSLVEPMARILELRFTECNADQLSALAHLHRRLGNHTRASEVAQEGLKIDPDNRYCRKFLHLD